LISIARFSEFGFARIIQPRRELVKIFCGANRNLQGGVSGSLQFAGKIARVGEDFPRRKLFNPLEHWGLRLTRFDWPFPSFEVSRSKKGVT
jgi:hypothetical protein